MMATKETEFKPLSLNQHFQAPDDFVGRFGWLTGYSADSVFLNDVVERFSGQTSIQLEYGGRIVLAMMLDPGNPQISLKDVPGVIHLPIKDFASRPFALLHAKVALLGFQHKEDAGKWLLRMIVSTGNWCQDTVDKTLDLVWCVDIKQAELANLDGSVRLAASNIKAAWAMIKWLRDYFDTRILSVSEQQLNESTRYSILFEDWVKDVSRAALGNFSNFFDNRGASLLKQLPDMIRVTGRDTARNYIAIGSGFYEDSKDSDRDPSVLELVVGELQKGESGHRLLTANPEINVFVNPLGCQSIARRVEAMRSAHYRVCLPSDLECCAKLPARQLHAKFIFSANCQPEKDRCTSAWIYLGSGNMTRQGFAEKCSRAKGNLEAGVVLFADSLYWSEGRGIAVREVVTNILPIQREPVILESGEKLSPGNEMLERGAEFVAAPVAFLRWSSVNGVGQLQLPSGVAEECELLDESGCVIFPESDGIYHWSGGRPRFVKVRWLKNGLGSEVMVPVLDEFGGVASAVQGPIDIDAVWTFLADFPMLPDDEELSVERESESIYQVVKTGDCLLPLNMSPIRQMMQLVEQIAAKQTSISIFDWPIWCNRLGQTLCLAAGGNMLRSFTELKINPLEPLRHPAFRPVFAENSNSCEGRLYEQVLVAVEREWNVGDFVGLGKVDEAKVPGMADGGIQAKKDG